jgi:phosphopantothenoylcysteine synthetase/decarboxylase
MNILVTSGATREHIDSIRFISNISTGTLGCRIAEAAVSAGMSVLYIHGMGAAVPAASPLLRTQEIVSAADLHAAMERALEEDIRAVIHPMAVSDYTPRSPEQGKIHSDRAGLRIELVRTPKTVRMIKEKRPDVLLVSFKLESGISEQDLTARARKQIRETGSDLVAANLLEETAGGRHRCLLVTREKGYREVSGKENIASEIISFIREHAS